MKLPGLPEAKDVLVPDRTDPYPMRLAQYAMEIVLTQFVFHLVGTRTILLYGEDDRVKEGLCVGKEGGLSQDIWENSWIKEKRFKGLRRIWQTQQLVILLCSSFDWYFKNIEAFCHERLVMENNDSDPMKIKGNRSKRTKMILWISGIIGDIPADVINAWNDVEELYQVRNLGIHNYWAVDEEYRNKSNQGKRFEVGSIRTIAPEELKIFQDSLLQLIYYYAEAVGKRFYQEK